MESKYITHVNKVGMDFLYLLKEKYFKLIHKAKLNSICYMRETL